MASHRVTFLAVTISFLACGGTGAVTPPPDPGVGGAAGDGSSGQAGDTSVGGTTSSGGTGGAGAVGGTTAGTSAAAGKGGGASGAAGTATGGSGPFGGMTGTGGAGATGGNAGSGPFGPGGGGGSAGKSSGIIPTTCKQAHSDKGCCGPDGNLYFCLSGAFMTKTCTAAKPCGWNTAKGYYDCVSGGPGTDPAGAPITCGP